VCVCTRDENRVSRACPVRSRTGFPVGIATRGQCRPRGCCAVRRRCDHFGGKNALYGHPCTPSRFDTNVWPAMCLRRRLLTVMLGWWGSRPALSLRNLQSQSTFWFTGGRGCCATPFHATIRSVVRDTTTTHLLSLSTYKPNNDCLKFCGRCISTILDSGCVLFPFSCKITTPCPTRTGNTTTGPTRAKTKTRSILVLRSCWQEPLQSERRCQSWSRRLPLASGRLARAPAALRWYSLTVF